jgi:selenophosphate synthetase-related protein
LLTLEARDWPTVEAAFRQQGISSRIIGVTTERAELTLHRQAERQTFWNLREQPFTGFRARADSGRRF